MKKTILGIIATLGLVTTLNLVPANAAWKQNNTGWWYTEGSDYATGWKQIDSQWYYFDSDGYMKTGWVKDSNRWYYLNSTGEMKTGWVQSGNDWYYLDSTGGMVTDAIADNCLVDSNGKWVENNEWQNKVYNALGDSITKGINPSNSYQVMTGNRYSDILQRCLKLSKANNYGIEGTTIVHRYDNLGMVDRYQSMSDDADIISVFGGTNDFGSNSPMGSVNSGNNNEFKCAFNNLLQGLKKKYPSKKIFVITPTPRNDSVFEGKGVNPNGFKLQDYVNAEVEIAKANGIPVLNLYNGSLGITPNNEAQKNAYMPDGIHPNIDGMYIVSKKILQFIDTL